VTSLLATGLVKRLLMFLFIPGQGLFDPLTVTSSDFIHNYFPAVRVSFPALIDTYSLVFCLIGLVALWGAAALPLHTFVVYTVFLNALITAKSARHRAALIPIFVLAVVRGVVWLIRRADREPSSAL
jgi:hypothetical protein